MSSAYCITDHNPYCYSIWMQEIVTAIGFFLQLNLAKLENISKLGCGPLPVTVTTRIITFLIGDSEKTYICHWNPGRGPHPWFMELELNAFVGV